MPNTGRPLATNALMVGTAYAPVAAGSPGPLERKIPSGDYAYMSFAEADAGTTVTRQPAAARQRRMLRLAPKSMATT